MQEPRVTKEQAIKLKAAGFDWVVEDCYLLNSSIYKPMGVANWNWYKDYISRPTLSDATRWLREVKGWHVYASFYEKGLYDWVVKIQSLNDNLKPVYNITDFTTHDLAISAGIDEVLNRLEKEVGNG